VVAGLVLLTGLVLAVWMVPPLLYSYVTDAKERASAEASTRTGIIAGVAGLAALGSLLITSRTYRVTQQGHITDRYTKAIGQLGDDNLDVRLGGIYALERLAVDSERDHPTVVEVLGAFVRERSSPDRTEKPTVAEVLQLLLANSERRTEDESQGEAPTPPTFDVQAALSVLGRLPARKGVSRGDLSGANLAGANLTGANLAGARLFGTNLSGADLGEANLAGAAFQWANLSDAYLGEANLTGANFDVATLTGTWLRRADLTGAYLGGANLTNANFNRANLSDADLGGATLTDTFLGEVNLTDAKELTQDQIAVAVGDARTKLPSDLQRPGSWPTAQS
jgi:hypothetical protein